MTTSLLWFGAVDPEKGRADGTSRERIRVIAETDAGGGLSNHPSVRIEPSPPEIVLAGSKLRFSARPSTNPDGQGDASEWVHHPEAGTWRGDLEYAARGPDLAVTVPQVRSPETIHFVVRVTERKLDGIRPKPSYRRVVLTAIPKSRTLARDDTKAVDLLPTRPPTSIGEDPGPFRPVLTFADGRPVRSAADWAERRHEILRNWHAIMGPWPALLEQPKFEVLERQRKDGDGFERRRVRVEISHHQFSEGWLLIPDGRGPFPAILVPFYEPETSIGLGRPLRDFALRLTRRGFVTLSIGSPGGDARRPETGSATCQPLSFLAYVAANAGTALARLPEVDAQRLGITGHSYGGKWALFGACLDDRFAAGAWSDPGIVWDETRPNVNYWDVWYLGKEPGTERKPGIPSSSNPATGAYPRLVERGHDLHELMALMCPRPFLVSGGSEDPADRWRALQHARSVNRMLGLDDRVAMTLRPTHDPTEESNAQLVEFFARALGLP